MRGRYVQPKMMTFRLTILALTILAFTTKSDKVVTGKIYSSENPSLAPVYTKLKNLLVKTPYLVQEYKKDCLAQALSHSLVR